MGLLWLALANVVLFGLIRYISQSKRHRKEAGKVNWDGWDAVSLTLSVYLLAQLAAVLVYSLGIAVAGTGSDVAGSLRTSVGAQFLYTILVEVFTLGSLHGLLKLRGNGLKMLGLQRPQWIDLGFMLTGFAVYFVGLLVVLGIVQVAFPEIDLDQKQQIGFESAQSFWQLAMVFVSLVVLPPLTEEILTRGFLYLGLKKHLPKVWAILITSAMFAAAHLQFGNGAPLLWAAAIDTFILSLVLIWVRDATNRLWAPIGLHALKNGIAFLALFVFSVT